MDDYPGDTSTHDDEPRSPAGGHLVLIRVLSQVAPPQRRFGLAFAGIAEGVGEDVTGITPGDAVFGLGDGAFAGYLCAAQHQIALKPDGLSFERAAAMAFPGLAALQCLRDDARLKPGERVLVIGASGGVGRFAVRIARHLGAHVTGVDDDEHCDQDDAGTYDVIVRADGSHAPDLFRRAASEHGRVVPCGFDVRRSRLDLEMLAALIAAGALDPTAYTP